MSKNKLLAEFDKQMLECWEDIKRDCEAYKKLDEAVIMERIMEKYGPLKQALHDVEDSHLLIRQHMVDVYKFVEQENKILEKKLGIGPWYKKIFR